MLLWFAGASVVIVWFVFKDPRIDYRLVVAGALLPDLLDAPFGGTGVGHTLAASVLVLVGVMLLTIGRRPARRRWLGLPIGMLLHLALDAAFTDAGVFWWPFSGATLYEEPLPSIARGGWSVLLELAGAGLLWWVWRHFRLDDPGRRAELLRTGHLVDQ